MGFARMKMPDRRPAGKRAALIALAVLCTGALAASAALAQPVRLGNIEISIEGGFSPKKLSRHRPTPITLQVEGSIKTVDGTHPPALKTLALEFDKHGKIFTKGLPVCKTSQVVATPTKTAKQVCKKALIGSGRVSADIALSEQKPFQASGPLLIFNGPPKGNKPVLVFHVYAPVPAPTAFVTTGVIGKAHGKYGTLTDIRIPTIVAGQGSLISFKAKIPKKTWTYKHRKVSLLTATCPSGHLFAHGEFNFPEATLSGNIVKRCIPGK